MNIGKIICLLLIIPLCCGCNEHETSSAPSFRQCFIEVYYSGGLELPMLQTGYFGTQPTVPPQNLQTGFVITPNYSHNNMCDSFSDPEEFLRLATRNDDTSFNQWVPDHLSPLNVLDRNGQQTDKKLQINDLWLFLLPESPASKTSKVR